MPWLLPIIILVGVVSAGVTLLGGLMLLNSSLGMDAGFTDDQQPGFGGVRGQASLAPDSPWLVCVGECEYAGDILYMAKSGATGEFLHAVYAMAGHECEAIGTMKLGDEVVPLDGSGDATGKYAGYIHVEKKLGAAGQTVFSGLKAAVPEWNNNCKAQGKAVVWVRLKYNTDLFPSGVGTLRLIKFLVKGRKLLDTRTSVTAWTDNAVLVARDHCASADWGFKVPAANFNDTVINAEANICDETVNLLAGGTEKRYTVNGVYRADEDPREILRGMLAACGGRVAFPAGKLAFYTAAWRGSSGTITDDDLRQDTTLTVMPRRPRDVIANAVRGRFFGPETNWQADDYVPYMVATTEEGQRIFADLDQRFVRTNSACMRLAKIYLLRLRRQVSVVVRGKLPLYDYLAPDVVSMNRANLGWVGKTFEVGQVSFAIGKDQPGGQMPGVDLNVDEIDAPVFAWDYTTEEKAKTASAPATAADTVWIHPPDQFVSETSAGPYSYASGGSLNGKMWIRWSWVQHTRYRNDESSITIAASAAATLSPTPALTQVAGGALALRTRFVRIALVKEKVMFHFSNEASLSVSANNLLQVTSPAAVPGYDGWVPIVGSVTNQEHLQASALPATPIAFGTDWTEPVGGATFIVGTQYSDDNVQLGGHVWNLAQSANFFFYASYDFLNLLVEFTGGALSALDPQQAARQNRINHFRDSAGAMQASTPAAAGSGSGSGGGGAGGGGML